LLGVFTASANRPGFAILKLDDKRQKGVGEGEEVAAGTKLVAVYADYVLLERAGVQQRVNLENKYADSTNKGIQPASGAAAANKQIDSALKQVEAARQNALSNRPRQPHR
jgi:type II secretory pathway component PulC